MLRRRDITRTTEPVRRLYACHDADAFPAVAMREMQRLLGGHYACWNSIAVSVPRVEVQESPWIPGIGRRQALFQRCLGEHPAVRHYLATGELGPLAISDFVSADELHRLRLYQDIYRDLEIEDQMGICLGPPAGEVLALALGRDRRGFTARERSLLELMKPHVIQAWHNARSFTLAQRRLEMREEAVGAIGCCMMEIDERGVPVSIPRRAAAWLREYYGDHRAGSGKRLPTTLARWVKSRQVPVDDPAPGMPVLARRRGGRRLVARYHAADGTGDAPAGVLLLQELSGPAEVENLRRLGLSPREIDVLLEVELGKRNEEIAASLCISPLTVKKHLEHIFAKLGVDNRTAAAARIREYRSS